MLSSCLLCLSMAVKLVCICIKGRADFVSHEHMAGLSLGNLVKN
jgi:hypothetical protein